MNIDRVLRLFCLLSWFLWLTGCAVRVPEWSIVNKQPPQIILKNIRQNAEAIRAIKAKAKVSLQSLSNSGNGVMELLFRRGEKLRLTFRGPLGIDFFSLKWTGSVTGDQNGSLEVYIPTEQCIFVLGPEATNLRSLTGFSLNFPDLIKTFIRPLGDPDEKWSSGIRNGKLLRGDVYLK